MLVHQRVYGSASLWPCEYQPQMTLKTWVAASAASREIPDQNMEVCRSLKSWENQKKLNGTLNGGKNPLLCYKLPEGSSFVVRLFMISLAYPVLNIHTPPALHRKGTGQMEVLWSQCNPTTAGRSSRVKKRCCFPIKVSGLVNVYKKLWKITMLLIGKLTISMAIFKFANC